MLPTILHPKSTGHVGLKSKNIQDQPDIDLIFFDVEYDKTFAIKAFCYTKRLLEVPSFEPYLLKSIRLA